MTMVTTTSTTADNDRYLHHHEDDQQHSNNRTFVYNGIDKVPKDVTSVTFDTNTVTEISDYAFKDCNSLTSIVIPESITQIGNYAFYDCRNLKSVILPDSLRDIGNAAFDGCTSLMFVVIPSTVTKIRYRAFYRCSSLICVFLPLLTIRDIRNNAFSDCNSLALISIPSSVKTVLYSAFDNCHALKLANTFKKIPITVFDGSNDDNIGSWLQERFDHLPLHKLCYYYYYIALDEYDQIMHSTRNMSDNNDVEEQQNNNNNNNNNSDGSNNASSDNHDDSTISKSTSSTRQSNNHDKIKIRDEIITMIHDNPDIIQSTDELGMTPLHILLCACLCHFYNNSNTIYNSNNHIDNNMKSRMMIQIHLDMIEIMNEMIDSSFEVTKIKDVMRMTALDYYMKFHHIIVTQDLRDPMIPLSLLIKLGVKWDIIKHLILINPRMALQSGVRKFRKDVMMSMTNKTRSTDNDFIIYNDDEEEDNDFQLYPFMEAAVIGDLELTYYLALNRIDVLLLEDIKKI